MKKTHLLAKYKLINNSSILSFNMYKSMSLLVLVALAACVVSMETQDQETAEQYFRIHGVYPSWYPYGAAFNGVRSYPYTGYPAAAAYPGYYPSSNYPNSAIGFNRFPINSPYAGSRGWFDPDMFPFNFYNYNALPYIGPQSASAPTTTPAPTTTTTTARPGKR